MRKVKKRKLSIKKISLLLIPLLIIITVFIFRKPLITLYQSKVTGYPTKTIEVFNELKIYNKIKDHKYSDTLNNIVTTEYYNPKYLNNYLNTDYHKQDNFYDSINKLYDLGYTVDEVNTIYKSISPDSILLLTENDYLKDIINILKLNYFYEDNLERYLKYNKDKDLKYENLITYVNAFLDYKYYSKVIDITNPEEVTVLVNKYHKLASNYVPADLEEISSKYNRGFNNKMRHVAKEAFEKMCEAAVKDNIYIYSGSAYRSYNYQLNLYNRYVASNGFNEAETFSARAGYSEHQTGLATDILNKRLDYISSSDTEYTWLINNSYKYGFHLRYPKGKENITGYMYEEWHFRYLGVEIATYLHEHDMTYDEYVARLPKK